MKICLLEPRNACAKRGAANKQTQTRGLLEQLGHQVVEIACSRMLYSELRKLHPDVVFNLASGYGIEDGHLIPAIIEMAGFRYTGSGVLALSLGASYARLFPLLLSAGIPLPPFRIISHEEALLVEQVKGRKLTLFTLDQEPLFHAPQNEVCALVKKTCRLIEARGLARFDFVWADEATLVSIDIAPDPLDEELLDQAARAGWHEQQLLQMLLEHAGRDSDGLRPEGIVIRPFSLSDSELAELVKIENASFATDAYQIEDFRQVYLKCSELSVVAEIRGQIAGYMMTRHLPDKGDVFSVAVAPAYRRRAVGKALFRYTVKRLNEWGITKIELEVRKTNEAGASFWKRLGFAPVSAIPSFYDDGSEALLMRAFIDER